MPVEVVPETVVNYVPDTTTHWNNSDVNGDPLFDLLDAKTGKPSEVLHRGVSRDSFGRLVDYRGFPLTVSAPRHFWKAVIKAVYPDGTADLEIEHPRGDHKLGYVNVRHSDGKENNTWHLGA